MAETRTCEQCGAVFAPRREHARFCCARCRARWNREHTGDPAAGASALQWSVTAMTETIERLPSVRAWDRMRAFAAIGEAVWQVTLVDATLVRHHPDTYDRILGSQDPAQRRLTEQTLAGLRFVRNQIGPEASLAGFIQPGGPGARHGRVASWTWKPVPDPALAGSWHGTGPTRRTWWASPSERPSAGPRRSSTWPPRTPCPSRVRARMPDGDGAIPQSPLTAWVAAGESGPVIVLSGEADLTCAGQLSAARKPVRASPYTGFPRPGVATAAAARSWPSSRCAMRPPKEWPMTTGGVSSPRMIRA